MVLSCHLLQKRATTAIDAWWNYSLHGQQQGVKSAESDPGGTQSHFEGQRLRSVQVAAAWATELHQCTYTKAAHQYDHSAEKSPRTITKGGRRGEPHSTGWMVRAASTLAILATSSSISFKSSNTSFATGIEAQDHLYAGRAVI